MSQRVTYGIFSVLLGVAAIAAVICVQALTSQCGPADAIAGYYLGLFFAFWEFAIFGLLAVSITFAVGYSAKRKGVLFMAVVLACALGALAIAALAPHHYLPASNWQCRIDL